ncbi:MAG: hypothetical protein K0R34_1041 [Herbinix sp.]|jgi:hypothetical protein|nr:hypothetical protein [Herbinix sp.]
MSGFGFIASFGIFMGFVQWVFYILGIVCMIKYLRDNKNTI